MNAQAATLSQPIEQKELRRNIFTMIWPATIESILQMMVGIVATAMVGRLSAEALGAVGLGARIAGLVWAIFSAVGVGATVFVARSLGANDMDLAKRMAVQSLIIGVVAVLSLTFFLFVFSSRILTWFGAEGTLYELSFQYLRIVVWGMPFMALMQIVGAILRGAGNTRTPMVIAFIVNVINITVNYVLIFGSFGFPALGVRGAGVAAIVAQSSGAVIALWVLWRPNSVVPLRHIEKFRVNFGEIKRLLGVGLPVAGEALFWQFATILIMKLVVSFGAVALAAHQLGLTAESLSYMPSVGFSIAATTLVGKSLGQKDPTLAERYVQEIQKWTVLFTIVAASILLFLPKVILAVLTNEVAVINLAAYYLMMMALAQFPQHLTSVKVGALRGAGATRFPMVVAGLGLWAIRLPLAYILGLHFSLGIFGVWVAMLIDLTVRYVIILGYYKRGHWKEIKLL